MVGSFLFMITVEQIRMARALLRWGVRRLAEEAGVGVATLVRIESGGDGIPHAHARTLALIEDALDRAGVMLIPADRHGGPGVRRRV
ncbi:MAG: helix-turn-helix transcriptional regulator [Acidobacteria bacterium]|nr:helix-turn-helix transcriptional regulator [Acidobacteriota bacterium]